jgi:hypothetical protein
MPGRYRKGDELCKKCTVTVIGSHSLRGQNRMLLGGCVFPEAARTVHRPVLLGSDDQHFRELVLQ